MSKRVSKIVGYTAVIAVSLTALLGARIADPSGPSRAEATAATADASTVSLRVEGMTCASCTVTVRMALKKLDGVTEVTVKLDEKLAIVMYQPAKVTPEQLVAAVNKAGYKATVASK